MIPITNQKTFSLTAHKDAVVGSVSVCEKNPDVVLYVCKDGVEVAGVNVTVLSNKLCANVVPCMDVVLNEVVSNTNIVSDVNVTVDASAESSSIASVHSDYLRY